MNKKALIIGGGAVALVAIIVALIFIFVGGEDAYRSIKVFEIDGSCKVERDGARRLQEHGSLLGRFFDGRRRELCTS